MACNPVEPAGDRLAFAHACRIAGQGEKRGLKDVLLVLPVPERPAAHGQDQRPVTLHERGERGLVVMGAIGGEQLRYPSGLVPLAGATRAAKMMEGAPQSRAVHDAAFRWSWLPIPYSRRPGHFVRFISKLPNVARARPHRPRSVGAEAAVPVVSAESRAPPTKVGRGGLKPRLPPKFSWRDRGWQADSRVRFWEEIGKACGPASPGPVQCRENNAMPPRDQNGRSGGIGRRARLRAWFPSRECRFKSCLRHLETGQGFRANKAPLALYLFRRIW